MSGKPAIGNFLNYSTGPFSLNFAVGDVICYSSLVVHISLLASDERQNDEAPSRRVQLPFLRLKHGGKESKDLRQYCSLRYLRWFDGWCPVNLRNGRSRTFVRCVWRVSAFHHPRLDFSTTGFTQQFRRRLKQQPIPCFLALRGEGPQIGAGFDALTAPWP